MKESLKFCIASDIAATKKEQARCSSAFPFMSLDMFAEGSKEYNLKSKTITLGADGLKVEMDSAVESDNISASR